VGENRRVVDEDAFRALTEPHRRELLVHCYRMLGSFADAEDALQETLVAAWQGLDGFAGRSSARTWLYSIATNRCLNAMRTLRRRPAKAWDIPGVDPPEPTRLGEVVWLEPLPDARADRVEAISLAFVTALQRLPPQQVAVVILRDVVGFSAEEVAGMLETTVDAANSALKRARASLPVATSVAAVPSEVESALAARFAAAYEAADLDALVALLTADVLIAMPPMPFEYQGRELVADFFGRLFRAGRRWDLVPTRANGQPAFASYLRASGEGVGLFVLGVTDDGIGSMLRFEGHVLPWFGLPPMRPG
jgi:RNA polymerase sigma-70 factor (TIGR02960 family)